MHDFMKTIISAVQTWTKKLIKNNTPDWNQNDPNAEGYIKNRPFYASGAKVSIMPETAISNESLVDITEPLAVGNTYTVTFDGVDYKCVCREYDGYYMLGNNAIYEYDNGDETDTGEPFAVEAEGDSLQLTWYLQNDGEHTASISQAKEKEIIQKIDKKYLPEMSNIGAEGSGVNAEIFNNYDFNKAIGDYSHAEGYGTIAYGESSHAEGQSVIAYGYHSHAEGSSNAYGIMLSGDANATVYNGSFANSNIKPGWVVAVDRDLTDFAVVTDVTDSTITLSRTLSNTAITEVMFNFLPAASGGYSHVEGCYTATYGSYAHAEGKNTVASGDSSHAEGSLSTASGTCSHAEGQSTNASGHRGSHAEGRSTTASGESSHAEGRNTVASGQYTHAEGYNTTAGGYAAHAEGQTTIATGQYQHAQGKYNIEDKNNKHAHIVGNGTSTTARSNAHTLDWDGNAWYQTSVCVGGTNGDSPAATLAANGLVLTDETTGAKYRLFINNGELTTQLLS